MNIRNLTVTTCATVGLLVANAVTAPVPASHAASLNSTDIHYSPLNKAKTDTSDNTYVIKRVSPKQKFEMVGVAWRSGGRYGDVELRVRTVDNKWTEWQAVDTHSSGADSEGNQDSTDTAATELWYSGMGSEIEVRVKQDDRDVLKNADLVSIAVAENPEDKSEPLAQAQASASGIPPRPVMITREQWGVNTKTQKCKPGYTLTQKTAVLHHTANQNNYSRAGAYRLIRGIHAYHTKVRGWCDMGYQYIVDRYGRAFEGRRGPSGRAVRGAHVAGFNKETFGVSLLGTYSSRGMSWAQMQKVSDIMAWRLGNFYRNPAENAALTSAGIGGTNTKYKKGQQVTRPRIIGHRDLGSTTCPGNATYRQLPKLRQMVAQKVRNYKTSPVWKEWQKRGGEKGWLGDPRYMEQNIHGGVGTTFYRGAILIKGGKTYVASGGIGHRYAIMNGLNSILGQPITGEYKVGRGQAQSFAKKGGAIYWTPQTGAEAVYGGIHSKWKKLGGAAGHYGFPTSSEKDVPGSGKRTARYNTFERGGVYWTPQTGAHGITKGFYSRYQKAGGARTFGYPTSEESTQQGIARQTFDKNGGAMYWSRKGGLHYLNNKIEKHYSSKGFSKNPYGYPTSGIQPIRGGAAASFQNADIHDQGGTIREVRGSTRSVYNKYGGFKRFGVAKSSVVSEGKVKVQRFHHLNSAIYQTKSGTIPTYGAIGWKYHELRGAAGSLGAPLSAEYNISSGAQQKFERGIIRWDRKTGKVSVVRS